MTQGAHDGGGGFGQSAGGNAARGILVIVAAVLLGLVLLNQGLGGSDDGDTTATGITETTDANGESTGTTSVESPDEPAEDTTTSTSGVARPPGEVAVLVLNGTDGPVAGIAGAGANKLKTNNYLTRDPKNASTPSPSAVYYVEGFEAEAVAVAGVFGADAAVVVKPLDAATVPVADTQSADIVVVVGNDGVIVV